MALSPVFVAGIGESKLTMRWLQPYVTEGLNRKHLGIPKGIVRGFNPKVGTLNHTIDVEPDPEFGDSVMVAASRGGDFSITYREGSFSLDLTSFAGQTVIVWFEHEYVVSSETGGLWRAAPLDGGIQGSVEQVRDLGIGLCVVKLAPTSAVPEWVLSLAREEQGRDVGDQGSWKRLFGYQFNTGMELSLASEGLPAFSPLLVGSAFKGKASRRFGTGDVATDNDLPIRVPGIGVIPSVRSEIAVMLVAKLSGSYVDSGESAVTLSVFDLSGALVDEIVQTIDFSSLTTSWGVTWVAFPLSEFDGSSATCSVSVRIAPDPGHTADLAEVSVFSRLSKAVTDLADASRDPGGFESKLFSSIAVVAQTAPALANVAAFDAITAGPRVWALTSNRTFEIGKRWSDTSFHTLNVSVLGELSVGAGVSGKVNIGRATDAYSYSANEEVGGVYFGRSAALMPSGKRASVYAVHRSDGEIELRLASLVNSTINDAVRILAKDGSDQPTEVTLFARGNQDALGVRRVDLNFGARHSTTEYTAAQIRSQRSSMTGTQASVLVVQVNSGSALKTVGAWDWKALMLPRVDGADKQLICFSRTVLPADNAVLGQVHFGAMEGSVTAESWDGSGGAASSALATGGMIQFSANGAWTSSPKQFPSKMSVLLAGGDHKAIPREVMTLSHDSLATPYLEMRNITPQDDDSIPTRTVELRFVGTGAGDVARPEFRIRSQGIETGQRGLARFEVFDGTNYAGHLTLGIQDSTAPQTAINGASFDGPLTIGQLTSQTFTDALVYDTATKRVGYDAKTFTGFHNYDLPDEYVLSQGHAVIMDGSRIALANAPRDPACIGIVAQVRSDIYNSMTGDGPGKKRARIASVGDNREHSIGLDGFFVCDEGGPIGRGTLLCTSSRPGYLMAQGDDLVRSYTVGKSLEDVKFGPDGSAAGVYGILMCG